MTSLPLLIEFVERHMLFVTLWIVAFVSPLCCQPLTLVKFKRQVFEKHIHRRGGKVDVERVADEE